MDLDVDVLVVGAGPGGSTAARYAALGGARTLLIEKRTEIGTPVRCGEGVAKRWLDEVGLEPSKAFIAHEVDGAGKTLTPGLIDCHVHLCFDGSADFAGEAREMTNDAVATVKAVRNAARNLEHGVTTVRDLGGLGVVSIEVARAVARGGRLTIKNTFVIHPSCNRSMATKTRAELARTLGLSLPGAQAREALSKLSMAQLRVLANKHGVKVKGRIEEGVFFWSENERKPPTKRQYVNALAKVLTAEDLKKEIARMR